MLTYKDIKNAKPKAKDYQMADEHGLVLRVYPSGKKTFFVRYRASGKQGRLRVGEFPTVSLTEARTKARAVSAMIDRGIDPTGNATLGMTFEVLARQWLTINRDGWSDKYYGRVASRVEDDLITELGPLALGDIKAPHVLEAIRLVESRGALDMARRILSYAGAVFALGIAEGHIDTDPTYNLIKALKPKPKTRHQPKIKAEELPTLLERLDAYDGDRSTVLAMKLILHTFVRTGELRDMHQDELRGDSWIIPGHRMKMELDHIVPLSEQSQALIEEVVSRKWWKLILGPPGRFVFRTDQAAWSRVELATG